MKKVLLWTIVGLVVFVVGAYLVVSLETPDTAFARIQKHIQNEEWEKVYANLSLNTQKQLEVASLMTDQHLNVLGVASGEKRPSSKERFARTVPKNKVLRSRFETRGYTVLAMNESNGSAILTISVPEEAQARIIKMAREHGTWVLDLNLNEKPN